MTMTLSEELKWRGQIKDKTFAEDSWLNDPKTFYLGSDCSSDSLAIGNLAIYMLARRLAKHGWKTVLLVGGATSLIGDPGGKDEERNLKTAEEIEHNVKGIEAQVKQLLAGSEFVTVNNYDWFKDIGYLEFLRDVGKHYSMTELLQRDFIVQRIGEGGSGISYAEFSYSLIQGYDYWHLYKKHKVELQIGGSDQWGNMLSGVPLIRKKENAEVHALSMPLVIDKATGRKFGKSEEGAVWLDPAKTSVFKFYQFWLNVDDETVADFLKIYTELDKEEFSKVMVEFEHDRAGRLAQKTLAFEVTKLIHGHQKAEAVVRATEILFQNKQKVELTKEIVEILSQELATVELGQGLVSAMVAAGLAKSNSEAARFILEGAVYLNGEKVHVDNDMNIPIKSGFNLVRRGKNSFAIVNKK